MPVRLIRHVVVIARGAGWHNLGGMEQHTDNLVAALRGQGYHPTLVTTHLPARQAAPLDVIEVAHTRPNRCGRAWKQELERTLAALHARHPIDLAMSQSTAANPALEWLIGQAIPTVYILHGSALESARALERRYDPLSQLRRWKALKAWRENQRLLPRVPRLVAVSPRLEQSFRQSLDLHPGQLIAIENAVADAFHPPDPETRRAHRAHWPQNDAYVVGYAGRLTPEKGVLWLMEWARSETGVALAIAGAGPLERNVVRAAKRGDLWFAGRLGADALAAFYGGLDVFALPTRYFEGLPLAILEAMASGIPVVAYATGGIGDWFAQAETPFGIAVPPGDRQEFANALMRLRHDPGLREAMGQAGVRAVVHRHWPAWVDHVITFATQNSSG